MTTIQPDDPRIIWNGTISLEKTSDGVTPWRLPFDQLDFHPEDGLRNAANLASGVRIRFGTNANTIELDVAPLTNSGNVDLYADDELITTIDFVEGDETLRFAGLPDGDKTVEIWLHQGTRFVLREIRVDDGADVERREDPRPRWITYGSSITHCKRSASPSFTWPGVVARAKGLNFTSLGFGGQCHADPMIARLVRDLPADFISLKMGINIYGQGSLNHRSYPPALIGTIATIRDGHPDIPLVVCSPIWSPAREDEQKNGINLKEMREYCEYAVDTFRKHGDDNIHYVDGLKIYGPELKEFMPDLLHPDPEGNKRMGANFLREVFDEGLKLEIRRHD